MPKDLKRKVAAAPEPGQTSKNFVDGLDDLKANPKPQATPPSKMSFKTREGAYGC
jgi:hypothetical protein